MSIVIDKIKGPELHKHKAPAPQTLKMKVVSTVNATVAAITYGFLYNWYAIADARNIAPAGWHAATDADYSALVTYLGGLSVAGGKLKSTAAAAWSAPNTAAANLVGFNAQGGGYRNQVGQDFAAGIFGIYGTPDTAFGGTTTIYYIVIYNDAQVQRGNGNPKNLGYSLRLVKDATAKTHGQTGTMIDNAGNTIPTICINGVEWTAANSIETKYRDGSAIALVDSAAWGALVTGGRCSYNNDAAYSSTATGETTNTVGADDFLKFVEGAGINLAANGNTLTIAAATGSAAGTVCAGNDARLSDTRIPGAASVDYAKIAAEFKGNLTITGNNLDWATGFFVPTITLVAGRAFTFSNLEPGKTIVLKLTGPYTATWPSSVQTLTGAYAGAKINYLVFTCLTATEVLLSIQTMP